MQLVWRFCGAANGEDERGKKGGRAGRTHLGRHSLPLAESLPLRNLGEHPPDLLEDLGTFVVKVDVVPFRTSPRESGSRRGLLDLRGEEVGGERAGVLVGSEVERSRKGGKGRVGSVVAAVVDLGRGEGRPQRGELDRNRLGARLGAVVLDLGTPLLHERGDRSAVLRVFETITVVGEDEGVVLGGTRARGVEEEVQRQILGGLNTTVETVASGAAELLELVETVDGAVEL